MSHLCDTGNGRKCVLTPLHKAIVMTLGDETPGEDENMNRYWLVVVSDWQKISDGATRFVASACMWITATRKHGLHNQTGQSFGTILNLE